MVTLNPIVVAVLILRDTRSKHQYLKMMIVSARWPPVSFPCTSEASFDS